MSVGDANTAMCQCQQLTSVFFSDFRISRKTQEKTVSLLQRKGKFSLFFATSADLLISCQTCHPTLCHNMEATGCHLSRGPSAVARFLSAPLLLQAQPWSLSQFYVGVHCCPPNSEALFHKQ